MKAERIITVAKSKLLLDYPFFGTLAVYLKPLNDRDRPSMGTDGRHLIYNGDFVSKQGSINNIMALIAHVVMHCALDHIGR